MAIATFTVKRSELRQGLFGEHQRGEGYTAMANVEGFMCCLGCIFVALGVLKENMVGYVMPAEVVGRDVCDENAQHVKLFAFFDEEAGIWKNTALSDDAANINDDVTLTHEEREAALITRFKRDDIELIIVD